MSIKVVRINFWNGSEEESKKTMEKVRQELKEKNTMIHNCDKGWITEWHFGNYCLPGVPYEIAKEIADREDLTLDLEKDVIEENDIKNIGIGDKVTLTLGTSFGISTGGKGTVIDKNNNSLIVRKYKSKTKGWAIREGDVGNIVLGWH